MKQAKKITITDFKQTPLDEELEEILDDFII